MTSPMYCSGVMTSTFMMVYEITGLAIRLASRNAMRPASSNESWSESTLWNLPTAGSTPSCKRACRV